MSPFCHYKPRFSPYQVLKNAKLKAQGKVFYIGHVFNVRSQLVSDIHNGIVRSTMYIIIVIQEAYMNR